MTEIAQDEIDRCFICNKPFKAGDMVLMDESEGLGHRACFGEDREGYSGADGEPLRDDEPIPTSYAWAPDPVMTEETKHAPISDERLAEMLAGLEGVTPGPWECEDTESENGRGRITSYAVVPAGAKWSPHIVDAINSGVASENVEHDEDGTTIWDEQGRKDCTHIARLDPDTIRALITELQERRAHPLPSAVTGSATHRHRKRGSEYLLLGLGKMQAENWLDTFADGDWPQTSVDMREVAIYRSADDGSLWVRPREEFEDGRFEPIPANLSGEPHGKL